MFVRGCMGYVFAHVYVPLSLLLGGCHTPPGGCLPGQALKGTQDLGRHFTQIFFLQIKYS